MQTKMAEEEFKKYVNEMNENIVNLLKDNNEELAFYSYLVIRFNNICDEKKKKEETINKAIEFLENEYNSYSSAEEWRRALKDILKGGIENENN